MRDCPGDEDLCRLDEREGDGDLERGSKADEGRSRKSSSVRMTGSGGRLAGFLRSLRGPPPPSVRFSLIVESRSRVARGARGTSSSVVRAADEATLITDDRRSVFELDAKAASRSGDKRGGRAASRRTSFVLLVLGCAGLCLRDARLASAKGDNLFELARPGEASGGDAVAVGPSDELGVTAIE